MYNTVADYLKDDDFIKYILGDETHNSYQVLHGEDDGKAFDEAKQTLLAPEDVHTDFSLSEIEDLKHSICRSLGFRN